MTRPVRVLLIEPWLDGSHRRWAEGYRAASGHDVAIVGLPGRLWRWRLRGGAVPLAELVERWVEDHGRPDVLLVSGLVDVAQLLGLVRRSIDGNVPVVIYQHESQLVYPTTGREDQEAALRNWLSWCAADLVLFNSAYHRRAVLDALPRFIDGLPDDSHQPSLRSVIGRFDVVPVGVDVPAPTPTERSATETTPTGPVILWPHRWEHDKDPAAFVAALAKVVAAGHDIGLILAGEDPAAGSDDASAARHELVARFTDRVVAFGPFDDAEYRHMLGRADIVVSCAKHDFFGVAVVEAIGAGCVPVLPRALSYPELIPERWHDDVLYEPGSFGTALVAAVAGFDEGRAAFDGLAESMARFDWEVVGPALDDQLTKVV